MPQCGRRGAVCAVGIQSGGRPRYSARHATRRRYDARVDVHPAGSAEAGIMHFFCRRLVVHEVLHKVLLNILLHFIIRLIVVGGSGSDPCFVNQYR